MSETIPPDAVRSTPMRVLSAAIGVATLFLNLIVVGYAVLIFLLFDARLTVTGYVVYACLAVPLGFAFVNSVQIIRGILWRVFPWAAWLIALFVLAIFITIFLPYEYPLGAPLKEGWNG